jgi:excisionase family DNA binding protein
LTYRKRSETREDGKTRIDAPTNMEKLGFTVPEAAALSSLGQTSIYKAIREGQLRIRKYGTRTIITRADLASFLENLPNGPEQPQG